MVVTIMIYARGLARRISNNNNNKTNNKQKHNILTEPKLINIQNVKTQKPEKNRNSGDPAGRRRQGGALRAGGGESIA